MHIGVESLKFKGDDCVEGFPGSSCEVPEFGSFFVGCSITSSFVFSFSVFYPGVHFVKCLIPISDDLLEACFKLFIDGVTQCISLLFGVDESVIELLLEVVVMDLLDL